jgi:hypothetical protein
MISPTEPLPVRRDDVTLVDDGHDSLLVISGQTTSHVLNPTARAIWELCDGGTRIDEMVAAICEVFAVSPSAAASDVERTLATLSVADLIVWSGAEVAP